MADLQVLMIMSLSSMANFEQAGLTCLFGINLLRLRKCFEAAWWSRLGLPAFTYVHLNQHDMVMLVVSHLEVTIT